MPAISASAPGKVILFGEHAVVYGQPAIADALLEVEAKAIINPLIQGTPGEIRIQAPSIKLDADLSQLPIDDPLATAVRNVLVELGIKAPPPFKLRVTSTIPVAAGRGSGAAVSVAIIRAVSAFLGQPLKDARVSAIAFEVEKLHHGTPSGIDNTVITYRKPVYFIKGKPPESFPVNESFRLLIADTGILSQTRAVVGEVRAGWEQNKNRYEKIFKSIGEIAEKARELMTSGTGIASYLGTLMDQNQYLLQDLKVSSSELDRLIASAKEAGALGAKLSGAGRGGNIIAVIEEPRRSDIEDALYAAGATGVIATKVFGGSWGPLE